MLPYLYEGTVFDQAANDVGTAGFYTCNGTSPRGFKIVQLHHRPDHGARRWTVDTPEGLEMVRHAVAHLHDPLIFTWLDVLAVFERHPELAEINAQVVHKSAFDTDKRL